MHHGRETGNEDIAHRGGAREHAQIARLDPAVEQRRLERLHREVFVELGRLALVIQRIVPLADAVGVEDPLPDARRHGVVTTESRDDLIVGHGVAGR